MDVHIRTSLNAGWAGIDNAAISIGTPRQILEVQNSAILVNSVDVTASPPATIGGYSFGVTGSVGSETFTLDLIGGQEIKIERYGGLNTMSVTVQAHGSNFLDAEGMCGNWTAAAPGMVGRNGVTLFNTVDGTQYGEEWQVDTNLDSVFISGSVTNATCNYDIKHCLGKACAWCGLDTNNPNCCTEKDPLCQQRTTERRLVAPGVACENVTETRGAKANCMFDVFTTGNEDFATTISAYTDPIPDEPSSQCTEGGLNDCQTLNGVCVWRCDSTKAECRPNLCVANASGVQNSECSCMIPFDGICDNIFLAIINFLFGWLLAFFGIDLCP